MSQEKLAELRGRLCEVANVGAAVVLLSWDQETYMPPKAAPGRGQQLATLSAISHQMFTAPELGALLDELGDGRASLEPDDAALVAETRYDYDRAKRLPESFVRRFVEEQSKAYESWVKAREENRFEVFRPQLDVLVGLLKERAELLGYTGSPYNALLEDHERGMTAEELRPLFAGLAERQGALIRRIVESGRRPDTAWADQEWDTQRQWDFTMRVLEDMGFDFEAGRQDRSVHPFTTNLELYDVRVTTRVNPRLLFSAVMSSVHEGGHALYEQGFLERDRHTPLAAAPSLGLHESQSRMWENVIGRSRPFWEHYAGRLRDAFPSQLDGVSVQQLYEAVNRVEPSLIRVEADECTYNLHVILRFEIEVGVIEGRIAVADLPEVWNAKMKEYLGVDVPDDLRGCLQDIHWAHGSMGYFPTYTLGNLYASQIFERILDDLPGLWDDIAAGRFGGLLDWLREHIHRRGRRDLAPAVVRDVTGREPGAEAYLGYLERKYGELYGV
ncbi:MAG: carboxypeptidase M32 [Candidatus Hydrogenedentes bacterium]|nr:carboxypeptidase M32 [Candidatus Hydrogenedentota bacterium]